MNNFRKFIENIFSFRLITHHFNAKIEAFSNSQNNPLTENQVFKKTIN